MLTFHRTLFWAHLIAGLIAGLVILSMSVTGLLIAYEVQFMEWANSDLRVTPPSPGAAPLDIETLVARVREAKPDLHPGGVTWKSDPTAPAILTMGREGVFFANPYTGAFLGEGNHAWHDFFHAATDWHRFLAGTGLPREVGKAITGAGCLVFAVLLISGIYLWWPRHWRWPNVRAVILLNTKLKGRARDWNWHNVIGFWSAFPMLLIILTGLIMSYGWANDLLFRITGNEPPPPRQGPPGAPGAPAGPGGQRGNREGGGEPRPGGPPAGESRGERPAAPPASFTDLAPLLTQVKNQTPGWTSLSLRTPMKPGDAFPVMIDRGGRGQVHLRTMYYLDPAQGKVLPHPDNFQQLNLGRQLRMYARFLHTGELFGPLGQTIAALCALAATLLVWTGFALAWRRFFPKTKAHPPETTAA